jgi:putative N6-adenine-specific DNA methylase
LNGESLAIFLPTLPGLEPLLRDEIVSLGFGAAHAVAGGVELSGTWRDVWRINLSSRMASRVMVRVARFRAGHLSQLDKQCRAIDWSGWLPRGALCRVEAECRKSKIYHSGAAQERLQNALTEALGAPRAKGDAFLLQLRIIRDEAVISLDTSGELLHRRGYKSSVGTAPLRETIAAMMLRAAKWQPGEAVLDPFCGAGTFVIEAAEASLNLLPGRLRGFAFQQMPGFDQAMWTQMKAEPSSPLPLPEPAILVGADRDANVIEVARANAERAGHAGLCAFRVGDARFLERPPGPPGLVIANPPYGERLGKGANMAALYRAFGTRLQSHFEGWRVALLTSDRALSAATGLGLAPACDVFPHGGLKVQLWCGRI